MLRSKNIVALATLALAVGLSFIGASVQAESVCKGLESGSCQKKDACSWVEAYTRKDGVEVSGHCKSKPRKSAESDAKKKPESRKETLESKKQTPDTKKTSEGKQVKSDTKKAKSDAKKESESKKAKSDTKKAKSDTKKKSDSKKKSEHKKDKKE